MQYNARHSSIDVLLVQLAAAIDVVDVQKHSLYFITRSLFACRQRYS